MTRLTVTLVAVAWGGFSVAADPKPTFPEGRHGKGELKHVHGMPLAALSHWGTFVPVTHARITIRDREDEPMLREVVLVNRERIDKTEGTMEPNPTGIAVPPVTIQY